ncbi:methyltransferase domain-containing protein [Aquihabitans daechungensis]|uniref:methyltransferase domain-containing protein n=1 Tax=Aquihabitans daechungensis TaxID=1052257 RepID=UPI003BA01473
MAAPPRAVVIVTPVGGVVRSEKWWNGKVAPVVSVAGLALLAGPPATGKDLTRLVLFLVSAVGIAAFGHLVNDAADRVDDVRAGKPNPLVTWSGGQIGAAVLLALAVGVVPWAFLDTRPVARVFLVVEPLLLVAYAIAPLRLKGRGLIGALTDAAYAYTVPLVWTLTVFAAPGPLPRAALGALAAWATFVGLRSILWHQLADLDGDRRVGARTAVVRLGRARAMFLVAGVVLPLELLAGLALLVVVGRGDLPWLPWTFAAYVLWRLFQVRYLWAEPLLPSALRDRGDRVRLFGYVLGNEFIERWLPLIVTILLATESAWWWLAVVVVLVAFENAARDLFVRDLWGIPDALERLALDARTWFAIRTAARVRRQRFERVPDPVGEDLRARRRWVFVACGDDMHLVTLAVATEHLAALSSLEIWVVTDTTRNRLPVDEAHVDRVVDVRAPEDLDHHQASIWLKTGLGELLPEGEWCYLDTDVIAVAAGGEAVFDARSGPVAFASDLTHVGHSVDHFSTYAMTCSCRETRTMCGHLREQIEIRWDVEVPSRWLHWNGGVFVFGPEARPFLARWQEWAVASFSWPEWRTRDQGALIAAAWSLGLQDLPRLPRRFNFIADFDNPDLSFHPDLGWAHHPDGPWVDPVFLHLYTSPLHDEEWDFGRDTERVLVRKGSRRLYRSRADDFKRRAKEAFFAAAHAVPRAWWAVYRAGWAAYRACHRAAWASWKAVHRWFWAAWTVVYDRVYRAVWAVRRGLEWVWAKTRKTVRRLAPSRVLARIRRGPAGPSPEADEPGDAGYVRAVDAGEEPAEREPAASGLPAAPRYIDALIDDFAHGTAGRFNHLGHWSDLDADPLATGRAQAQLRMVEVLTELGGIADGTTVLDVGSGFGGTMEALDARFSDVVLIGLDIDERQLALCRDLAPSPGNHLLWIHGDGCALPLASGSVDHIVSIEAMWHFPSRTAFLAEAARVLRPGGSIVVVDLLVAPGASSQVGVADDAELAARLQESFTPWPQPQLTLGELTAMAESAGLSCREVIDATANTKATYLDHGDIDDRPGASAFASSPGVGLFVELHQRELLQVLYLRFERAASRVEAAR